MPEDMEEGSSPTLESASSAAVGTVDEASLPGLRLSRPVQSILAALDSCAEHSTAAACERLAQNLRQALSVILTSVPPASMMDALVVATLIQQQTHYPPGIFETQLQSIADQSVAQFRQEQFVQDDSLNLESGLPDAAFDTLQQ